MNDFFRCSTALHIADARADATLTLVDTYACVRGATSRGKPALR